MPSQGNSSQRSAKRQRVQGESAVAAEAGPLAGVAVFVRRNSLHSAQLDAWKRSLPALGGLVVEDEAGSTSASHAVVPTGSKGGWACLPQALQPGSLGAPAGLQYVTEHWMAACIRSQARAPECDFAPASAASAAAAATAASVPAMTATQQAAAVKMVRTVAAGAAGAADGPAAPAPQTAAAAAAAAATAAAVEMHNTSVGGSSSGSGGDPEHSSGLEEEAEGGGGYPGFCSERYARAAAQLRFAPELHADDQVTWSLLTWNVWDYLDRQSFEDRMLAVGREVARNDFPDVILFQEVSEHTLGLLGRQAWWAAYRLSPLPERIGRCCTIILLRKDRVGPPPGHGQVQWLDPYICVLNDTRDDMGFERDVKSVRCTILGRPVRISTTHIIYYEGGRRQTREVFSWLSQQEAINRGLDRDHIFGGDFNWHYQQPLPLPPGWEDIWQRLMPHDTGPTWSSLARTGKAASQARLDRVCARLQHFRPIQIDNLTGAEPIQGAVRVRHIRARGQVQEIAAYASDHRGLFTRFQLA